VSPDVPDSGGDQVLALEAGGQRYAVELTSVERVHPVTAVTPLPGLRPPWAGLVCLRGEMFPALELSAYLQKSPVDAGRSAAVDCAVVSHGGLRVAFLSEAPVTLVPRPAGGVVLDVATILADPALVVND
jgi:chemotaxis signal transduction protein